MVFEVYICVYTNHNPLTSIPRHHDPILFICPFTSKLVSNQPRNACTWELMEKDIPCFCKWTILLICIFPNYRLSSHPELEFSRSHNRPVWFMRVKWPRLLYPKMCHISCCLPWISTYVQHLHSRPNIGFLRTHLCLWISGCSSSSPWSSWCLVSLPTMSTIWWLTDTTWTEIVFSTRTGRKLEQEQWNRSVLSY